MAAMGPVVHLQGLFPQKAQLVGGNSDAVVLYDDVVCAGGEITRQREKTVGGVKETVLHGVFHQWLQAEKGNLKVLHSRLAGNMILNAGGEAQLLDREVTADVIQLLLKRDASTPVLENIDYFFYAYRN